MRQALAEYTAHSDARDETRHYFPKTESPPISKTDNRLTTPSSTSELNPPQAPLLLEIYWVSEIRTSNYNASKNDRDQFGKPMIVAAWDWSPVFSPLSPHLLLKFVT
jgi:hypothetical protein